MTGEVERIADQLRRAYDGPAWHGPSVRELLHEVSAAQAAAHPLAGRHSVWELVGHIGAWKRVVGRRLTGEIVNDLAPAEDWPDVSDPTEAAWERAKTALDDAQGRLLAAVQALPEGRLSERVPGTESTVYVMLHGLVQHDLYHAGQIALLRRG